MALSREEACMIFAARRVLDLHGLHVRGALRTGLDDFDLVRFI